MTRESEIAPSEVNLTPLSSSPSVIPVAAKKTSSDRTRSSVCRTRSRSYPASTAACRSLPFLGHSFPCISPPRHLSAAAEITPSGVPPTPKRTSAPSLVAVAIAPATSPSGIRRIRAPLSRTSLINSACLSRSSITAVRSRTPRPVALAIASRFSVGLLSIEIQPLHCGPTAIFSI